MGRLHLTYPANIAKVTSQKRRFNLFGLGLHRGVLFELLLQLLLLGLELLTLVVCEWRQGLSLRGETSPGSTTE